MDIGRNIYYRGCISQDLSNYNALMIVEQNLTEAQQAQVIENLGLDISSLGSMAYLNYRVGYEWEKY